MNNAANFNHPYDTVCDLGARQKGAQQKILNLFAMLLSTGLNNIALPTLLEVANNVNLKNIVTPDSASTILLNVVDNYKQCGQHNIVEFSYTAGTQLSTA